MKTENLVHIINVYETGTTTETHTYRDNLLEEVEKFILGKNRMGYLNEYPFYMVCESKEPHFAAGKKYIMIADENGMAKSQKKSKFDFDHWGMKVKFFHCHNNEPVHYEDLIFNGIFGLPGQPSFMHHYGRMVLVEDTCQAL